jgi:hypothetical protein
MSRAIQHDDCKGKKTLHRHIKNVKEYVKIVVIERLNSTLTMAKRAEDF